ncbi:hypothetical protein P4647_14645 [Peribacillus frigoritolerans]|uniref:hypothetical protein n=1 Tax=Peribacillus TaxID=2675229 RepID=UPI002E1A8C88|nr:hypothetical protein [Peribacillus frigoritolerans]
MPIGLAIFLWLIGMLILYIVIETAVRRGIDSSKLSEKIEIMKRDNFNKNK